MSERELCLVALQLLSALKHLGERKVFPFIYKTVFFYKKKTPSCCIFSLNLVTYYSGVSPRHQGWQCVYDEGGETRACRLWLRSGLWRPQVPDPGGPECQTRQRTSYWYACLFGFVCFRHLFMIFSHHICFVFSLSLSLSLSPVLNTQSWNGSAWGALCLEGRS